MQNSVSLEAKSLTKIFDQTKVVDAVSFQIYRGECFGILGPNGAGKSTLMKMMYGSVEPTDGELFVLGLNAKKNSVEMRTRLGVIPQEDGLDVEFTARENLILFSQFYGIEKQIARQRTEELLRLVRLDESANQYVHNMSGGMKRRLAIARGLINRPELLFLDEPTTGLDPQARIWIWEFLKKIKSEMGTLVLTTHYMEEAEKICDRIAILDRGLILAMGRPKDLIEELIGNEVVEFETTQSEMNYQIGKLKDAKFDYTIVGSTLRIHIKAHQLGRDVLDLIPRSRVEMRRPNLNDVFLKLAGHDLREKIQ